MLSYLVYQVVNLAVTIAVPAASYFGIRYLNDRVKEQRERLKRELKEHEFQQQQLEIQLEQQQRERRQQNDEWLISVAHEAVKFADQKYKHMEDLEDLNRHKLESAVDYILRNVADTDIDISVDKEIARDKIEVVIHDLHQQADQES
jgi:uncharacterized protein HemX